MELIKLVDKNIIVHILFLTLSHVLISKAIQVVDKKLLDGI